MIEKFLGHLKRSSIKEILTENFDGFNGYAMNIACQDIKTAYINLQSPLPEIKKNVRKSYKSLINWGYSNFEFKIISAENPNKELFIEFMKFHRKVAGKITRGDSSWLIQNSMIEASEAFALIGFYQNNLIAASLVNYSDFEAYYAVGVYDRDLMAKGIPIGHGLLFKSIEIAKNFGVKKFILGDVSTINSIKEENIAKFKSGFTDSFLYDLRKLIEIKY